MCALQKVEDKREGGGGGRNLPITSTIPIVVNLSGTLAKLATLGRYCRWIRVGVEVSRVCELEVESTWCREG